MDEVTIRLASLEDALAIAKVHVGTWQCAYRGQIPDSYLDSLDVKKRTEKWHEILKNQGDTNQNYVAVIDRLIVGFCTVGNNRDPDMDPNTGELWGIYVDANFMNQGVGSTLMNKAIEHLKSKNFTKATLWVLTSNEKTRHWYESKGWRVEELTKVDDRGDFQLHETRYVIDL